MLTSTLPYFKIRVWHEPSCGPPRFLPKWRKRNAWMSEECSVSDFYTSHGIWEGKPIYYVHKEISLGQNLHFLLQTCYIFGYGTGVTLSITKDFFVISQGYTFSQREVDMSRLQERKCSCIQLSKNLTQGIHY